MLARGALIWLCIACALVFLGNSAAASDGGGAVVPASRQANRVGVITIHGAIDEMTLRTLERRLGDAVHDGCDAVVIELDTPGGDLYATLAICHLLRTHTPANKVAWIRSRAFSAGAITALACREIVVAPDSVLGDAAPIAALPGVGLQPLPPAERAKLESPVLSEVVESARRNGYDERLVRAFVTVGEEVWLAERDDGKRLFMNAEECEIAFGAPPTRSPERYIPDVPPEPRELPAATNDESKDADFLVLAPRVTPAERGRWRLLGQVDTANELLTLRGSEALRYGLASATVADESELATFFGAAELRRYGETWSEVMVRFLVSWPVRAILIALMLICFVIELATPGVGVFGITAGVALLVLVGAPALVGLAEWWEILLVVVGLGLVAAEFLLVPGFGLTGALGALMLLVGLVFTFVGGDLSSPQSQANLLVGFFATLGAFILAGLALWWASKHLQSLPVFRRLVLETDVSNPLLAPVPAPMPETGVVGVALTDLRPSGRASFGDRVLDVRTTGTWVARGQPIRLAGNDGLGLIVEPAEVDENPA